MNEKSTIYELRTTDDVSEYPDIAGLGDPQKIMAYGFSSSLVV